MQQKLKIAMLITNYGFGGAQKAFADHSRILAQYGEVREYVFNDFEEKRTYDTGNPYYSLNVPGGGGIVGNLRNLRARIKAYRKFKEDYKPDISISFMEGADYVNMLSGGKDKKVIVIQGSKVGDKNISGLKGTVRHKLLMPWLYSKADKIIGVSEDIRKELTDFYKIAPEKVAVAHNFYDEENLAQRLSVNLPEELTSLFNTSGFKLITFARLAVQKNLGSLFPIFRRLKAQGQDVKLYIIGDGELREDLLREAGEAGTVWSTWDEQKRDGAACDIFFLGFSPNPMAFLKYAELFLLPSLWEGSPLALCEAMASGIAVCSADCPTGPREIIDETPARTAFGLLKNGGMMPMVHNERETDNINIWANSIAELIGNRPKLEALAKHGGERVKHFSKSALGPVWAKEYIS